VARARVLMIEDARPVPGEARASMPVLARDPWYYRVVDYGRCGHPGRDKSLTRPQNFPANSKTRSTSPTG
jgi:hypothetical protein